MKYFLTFFLSALISIAFSSCEIDPYNPNEEVIIDFFTYGKRFNFRETSIKIGDGEWTTVEEGNLFTLLGDKTTLDEELQNPLGLATYDDRTNLKTDFVYVMNEDLVFSYKLLDETLFFFDEDMEKRTDIVGEMMLSQDTTFIILHNTGISPKVSIKYILEK